MTSTLAHRGPDGHGLWSDEAGRCVLGHRRLSVIDTSEAGAQPMLSADGRFVISFNGEIYNFQTLSAALADAGVAIKGRTDTEVLIEALALWGVAAFDRLDGMFAFALLDRQTGGLLLARDCFGEKPLYYSRTPTGVIFASELQALERFPGFQNDADIGSIAELLTFQYVDAPRSIYASVNKLEPGCWLKISADGTLETQRYFRFQPSPSGSRARPLGDLADELEDILTRSLERRLIADVPLGAFLSGGVDSSTVAALVTQKLGRPLQTFSVDFDSPDSEHVIARTFAAHLGTVHRDERLSLSTAPFLEQAGALLDEPNGDSSCLPTYMLSGFARQFVTVAISGDGGDELFGGYDRYTQTLAEQKRRSVGLGPRWRPGQAYYSPHNILVGSEALVRSLLGFVPEALSEHLSSLRGELDSDPEHLLAGMRRTDAAHYLPGAVLAKVDRMSMRHSLEVRTPFLNRELARFAEGLPDEVLVAPGRGKLVLRELAYRYLPRRLIDLPKRGFGLPMADWARSDLIETAAQALLADDGRLAAAFGRDGIASFVDRQRRPEFFSPYQVWSLMLLESWLRSRGAKLGDWTDKRVQRASSPPAWRLRFEPVAAGVYLVQRTSTDAGEEGPQYPLGALPPPFLQILAQSPPADPRAEVLFAPDGDAPLDAEAAAVLKPLRSSVLLFPDFEAQLAFDCAAHERWARLGVRRLLMRNAHKLDEILDLQLGPVQLEPVDFLRLFPRRLAAISNRRGMGRLLGAVPFTSGPGLLNTSAELAGLPERPDQDIAERYAVFEGRRQLIPTPAAYDAIVTEGGGRHAVYNGRLLFSASRPDRLGRRPYWLVERSAAIEGALPVRMARRRFVLNDDETALALQAWFEEPIAEHSGPIVLATNSLAPGGAERQWAYLAEALAARGEPVAMLVDRLDGEHAHYLPQLKCAGVEVVELGHDEPLALLRDEAELWAHIVQLSPRLLPEVNKLLVWTRALRRLRPRAVFAQLDGPNLVAGYAAQFAGVARVVLSFRSLNPQHFDYLDADSYLPLYRILSKSPRVVLSGNSTAANTDYARWIGIEPGRVARIPNALAESGFRLASAEETAALRSELDLELATPVLLHVGRMTAEKEPFQFLDICARVASARPDIRAFMVGEGMLRPQVRAQIRARGLEGVVRLLGRRSDVAALMSVASVFVLPSRVEGMPNVLMEAQFSAVPVVATRVGGVPDTVKEGESALLRPAGDVQGLAEDCLLILNDPARALAMGDAGRRHIEASASPDAMAQRYLELLQ